MALMVEHEKFMDMALIEAEKALEAGEFPVGCLLVRGGLVVARGRRRNSTAAVNELDHAEIVALRSLADREEPGPEPAEMVAYATMEPCLMCYATLLLNGVHTIVYGYEDIMGGGLGLELTRLSPLYRDMTVSITGGVRRQESLRLFQRFFSAPANAYWQDSPLARYTLAQGRTDSSGKRK